MVTQQQLNFTRANLLKHRWCTYNPACFSAACLALSKEKEKVETNFKGSKLVLGHRQIQTPPDKSSYKARHTHCTGSRKKARIFLLKICIGIQFTDLNITEYSRMIEISPLDEGTFSFYSLLFSFS